MPVAGRGLSGSARLPGDGLAERSEPHFKKIILIAIAIQVLLALATTLVKLNSGTDDTDIYYRYASMTWYGKVPYRDFHVEYPPLALVLFLVPRLVAQGVTSYKLAF